MMNFTFISGASGGIGKAFSLECAKLGYSLFLTGRSEGKLKALREEILSLYPVEVDYFACDLSNADNRLELVSYIERKGYCFNRLCLVAGVDTQKPFMEYSREKLLFQMRVNAEATVDLAYSLLKFKAEKMEIVVVSSMSCVSPMPYFQVYSATKALLLNLFTALHFELKKGGVKVTTVLPGGVPTRPDIIEDIKGQGLWGRLSAKSPEFVAKGSLKAVRKNKVKYIPGFFNKFLHFIMKIFPERIVLKFIARRWKNLRKDAF